MQGGTPFIRVMSMGYKVFLDLKMHDIPNTVRMGVEALANEGIWALTLHGAGGRAMLEEACKPGQCWWRMILLGVTVLTSMNNELWQEVTQDVLWTMPLEPDPLSVLEAGIDGLVCSPLDLPIINETRGKSIKVVPGIRPSATRG